MVEDYQLAEFILNMIEQEMAGMFCFDSQLHWMLTPTTVSHN